jgi:hypothetical protein
MKATSSRTNNLNPIRNCFLSAKGKTVYATVLPELSDKHNASYADEQVMGRSMPVKTYASSGDRVITWKWKFVNTDRASYVRNLEDYNFLKSLTYPVDTPNGPVPYEPPPICNIRCGSIFSGTELMGLGLDVVCTDCSASFPTDVAWTSFSTVDGEDEDFIPMEFSVDTTFSVVYRATNLPGQQRIMTYGG